MKYESEQRQNSRGNWTKKWASTFLSLVFLVWGDSGWSCINFYIKSPEEEEERFLHLSTSEYAVSGRRSVGLLDPWPWLGVTSGDEAIAGSFLAAVFMCRGTRRGAAVFFGGVFLSGAGMLTGFGALPLPCLPPRVPLVSTEAVNVSRSWEADPNRSSSSVSAASANIESVPLRRLQESQHSLLYPGMEQYRARTSIWQKMDLSP